MNKQIKITKKQQQNKQLIQILLIALQNNVLELFGLPEQKNNSLFLEQELNSIKFLWPWSLTICLH